MVSKGDFIYRGDHLICPSGKLLRRSAFMRRDRATSTWHIRKTANSVLSKPGAATQPETKVCGPQRVPPIAAQGPGAQPDRRIPPGEKTAENHR